MASSNQLSVWFGFKLCLACILDRNINAEFPTGGKTILIIQI